MLVMNLIITVRLNHDLVKLSIIGRVERTFRDFLETSEVDFIGLRQLPDVVKEVDRSSDEI